ncbi:hypothetical protein B8W94_13175, partial [Lactococcus lactis]
AESGVLEEKSYTITSLSRKLSQPSKTVKTAIERLTSGGYSISEKSPYNEDDFFALQTVFLTKETEECTLNEAIDTVLADKAEFEKEFVTFNQKEVA